MDRNRYQMPVFEDGSEYGNPKVGTVIARRFKPDEWNALPNERKWTIIKQIEPTVAPAPARTGNLPRTISSGPPGDVLTRIAAGAAKSKKAKQSQQAIAEAAIKLRLPFQPPKHEGIFGG
jgi:hypothetical protein